MTSSPSGPTTRNGLPVKIAALQLEPGTAWGFTYVLAEKKTFEPDAIPTEHAIGYITEYEAWARKQGAVDPKNVSVKLVLEGNRGKPVRIIDIRPLKRCKAPLSGTLLYYPPQGSDESVGIQFDLDRARPEPLVTGYGKKDKGRNYFSTHTVSLKLGEQQTFQINAETTRQYCEFTLQLTIVADDKTVTQTIDNNGKPFRVTALAKCSDVSPCNEMIGVPFASYQALYVGGSQNTCINGAWTREDPTTYTGLEGC